MRKALYILSALVCLVGCSSNKTVHDKQFYMDFLYDNMPLPDKATYSEEYLLANVEKTLEVKEAMGWNIPEKEFMHFVLPLRVNNETLDDFRTEYADELCDRVKGMTLEQAVLEINHWCHEMATYKPSDARTDSPMATIRSGLGRCGEESVLGVAALRAAGIPARQVYTPRWAHTDDNHAWVEAWVDGKWYFLGACEPEAKLNMAWFNSPVSRALLLHTKVFGEYNGDEDIISRKGAYTEINVTSGYVPVRNSVVTVVDTEGKVVEGASVEFKIYNYAEFYTVATYPTAKDGKASLHTGLGDMLAWASKGDLFGYAKISSDNTTVVLDHKVGEVFSDELDIIPPDENPIPTDATDEEIAACKVRFDKENEMRDARDKSNPDMVAFRASHPQGDKIADALLKSISFKDNNDITLDVLEDAYNHVDGKFSYYRDCPRIENEFLLPYFDRLSKVEGITSAEAAAAWTMENIQIDNASNPQQLRMPPVSTYKERKADELSRNIFFVALCRANGIEARIDPVTGKTQYRKDNQWMDEYFGGSAPVLAPQGTIAATYSSRPMLSDPEYYRHFSLAKIENGTCNLLSFDENGSTYSSVLKNGQSVDQGYYLMTSGQRMANGGVLVHLEFFNVNVGEKTTVPLVIRQSESQISVLGTMDAEALFTKEDGSSVSILSETGRGYFIVAVVGDKDEPTNHAMVELSAVASDLNSWGRKVVILGKARPSGLQNAVYGTDPDGSILKMLTTGCESQSKILPVVTVCDSFGRIVYFSQGYNTSLGEDLRNVIDKL